MLSNGEGEANGPIESMGRSVHRAEKRSGRQKAGASCPDEKVPVWSSTLQELEPQMTQSLSPTFALELPNRELRRSVLRSSGAEGPSILASGAIGTRCDLLQHVCGCWAWHAACGAGGEEKGQSVDLEPTQTLQTALGPSKP